MKRGRQKIDYPRYYPKQVRLNEIELGQLETILEKQGVIFTEWIRRKIKADMIELEKGNELS